MKVLTKTLGVLCLSACALGLAHCGEADDEEAGSTADVVEDHEWQALVDSDDPGELTDDEEPAPLKFSDLGAEKRPGTKLIMVVAAAGWCSPCQSEAAALSQFAADYKERGVAVATAIIQDGRSNAATPTFAKTWAETFELTVPTIIDTEFATGRYFSLSQMPATMIVDAETFEVLKVEVGADTGSDPLGKYRDLVDFYLSSR